MKITSMIKLFLIVLLTACSSVSSNVEANNTPYDLTKKITVDLVDKISTDKLNLEETKMLLANKIIPFYNTKYMAAATLGDEFRTLGEIAYYSRTYTQYVSLYTNQVLGEVYNFTKKIEISNDSKESNIQSIPVTFILKDGRILSGSYIWSKDAKTNEWRLVDFHFYENKDGVFDPDKHLALTLNNIYLNSKPFAKKVKILNEWINKLSKAK